MMCHGFTTLEDTSVVHFRSGRSHSLCYDYRYILRVGLHPLFFMFHVKH
nr:MAG TPA: hypothetical protein [Caudoviricetes sp.]